MINFLAVVRFSGYPRPGQNRRSRLIVGYCTRHMVTNESMRIERFRSNSTGTVEENLTRPRVRINLVITAIQYRVVLIKQSPTVASNRNNVSISFVVFSVSATLLVAFRRPPFPTFNPAFAFPQFTRHIRMTISTSPDGFFLLVRNTTLCHHTRLELFTRAPCRSSNDRPPDLLARRVRLEPPGLRVWTDRGIRAGSP